LKTSLLNLLIKLKTVSLSKSECLRNRPLNYKAHSVWRFSTERLLLFLASGPFGFVSRPSSGRILGALRDMCDSNRHVHAALMSSLWKPSNTLSYV